MDKTETPVEPVPFAVYEAALSRADRSNRRLVYALALTVVLLFASYIAFLYAWTSYDYLSDTVTVESTAGHANFIGTGGSIYNGEDNMEGP